MLIYVFFLLAKSVNYIIFIVFKLLFEISSVFAGFPSIASLFPPYILYIFCLIKLATISIHIILKNSGGKGSHL